MELLPPLAQRPTPAFLALGPDSTEHNDGASSAASTRLDRFLNIHEVKLLTSLGKTAIYAGIRDGSFPAPYAIAKGRVAWSAAEIATWQRRVRAAPRHASAAASAAA